MVTIPRKLSHVSLHAGKAVSIAVLGLMAVTGCGDEDSTGPDTNPPGVVTNLAAVAAPTRASSVTLTWTAPGDDGSEGTASEYDIRYSTGTISESNFGSAPVVPNVPSPRAAGATESITVPGLANGSPFTFALRTADDAMNWSALSNIASTTTVPALLPITADAQSEFSPAWSPAGDKIAFESDRSGNNDIWVIPAQGGSPLQLTTDIADDEAPCWSPDGTMIAFGSGRSGGGDIWVIPSTGGVATRITTSAGLDFDPTWSPDGSKIAFTSTRSGNYDIWTIPAAGGTATQITTDPNFDASPAWSPDGSTIAFASDRTNSTSLLWTVPATGGTATPVTTAGPFDDSPTWSPDGNMLGFVRADGGSHIWVIPSSGGTATQITDDPGNDDGPAWSPGGGRIAFRRGDDLWSIAID